MATNQATSRAFAVWWKEFDRWSVGYFQSGRWYWPPSILKRVTDFAKPESISITVIEAQKQNIPIIAKINFSGELFLRNSDDYSDYKGRLFLVKPNRFIFSKINAKRGCIYFAQEHQTPFAVSSEYPILTLDTNAVLGDYFNLAMRVGPAREGLVGFAAGMAKARTNLEDFLNIKIPLPPLAEQKAIVARWRKAQDEIAAARERVAKQEAKLPKIIYRELGTPPPLAEKPTGKCLAMWWKDLERWSFNYLSRSSQGLLGFGKSKFPIEPLGKHLIETMNGYCIRPVAGPTPHKMLKLNALNPAGLDLTASKFITIPDKIAKRFSIRKGDLFICRSVGSYDHVAKCALATEDALNSVFPDTMIRVQLKESLLPEYVREVVQTPLGRSFFQSNARTAVGMWKIGADDIANFPIPVPPLPVQRQIMERVAAGREEIAREREIADRLARESKAEVEALILGTRREPSQWSTQVVTTGVV